MKQITAEQIAKAKKVTQYSLGHHEAVHQNDDSILIAYEWLDAQKATKCNNIHRKPLKHLIEEWGGFYVSTDDVDVAITLHEKFNGMYWNLNISRRLVYPCVSRLSNIQNAFKHENYQQGEQHRKTNYKIFENLK